MTMANTHCAICIDQGGFSKLYWNCPTEYHCWTWYNRTNHICNHTVTSMWAWSVLQATQAVRVSVVPISHWRSSQACVILILSSQLIWTAAWTMRRSVWSRSFLAVRGCARLPRLRLLKVVATAGVWMAVIHSLPTTTAWGAAVLMTLNNASRSKCQHARSQGSALNLFLAHMRISTLWCYSSSYCYDSIIR